MTNHYPFGWLPPLPEPRNALLDFIDRPTLANALQTTYPTTGTMFGSLAPKRPKTEWVDGYWRSTGNPFAPFEREYVPGYWRSLPW